MKIPFGVLGVVALVLALVIVGAGVWMGTRAEHIALSLLMLPVLVLALVGVTRLGEGLPFGGPWLDVVRSLLLAVWVASFVLLTAGLDYSAWEMTGFFFVFVAIFTVLQTSYFMVFNSRRAAKSKD